MLQSQPVFDLFLALEQSIHLATRYKGVEKKYRFFTRSVAVIAISMLMTFLFVFAGYAPQDALAQDADVDGADILHVAIKPLEPFVFVDGDKYTGFSIELWDEIAVRLQRDFEYVLVDTVQDQLRLVEAGEVDAAITAISVTREREERVDFSQPYFQAGLQIMTNSDERTDGWVSPLEAFFSLDFLNIFGTLVLSVLVAAHLIWLVERRSNPDFPRSYLLGVWDATWYAVVTLTTVGYGDRTARTTVGRVIALVWMFTSLFLVANFTANMTTNLTLTGFQGLINGVDDLPGKRLATVNGSTAADYLKLERLPFSGAENIDEAIGWLHDDQVDAIIYDSPVLLHYANTQERGRVEVVGNRLDTQNYAVAIPFESPERKRINLALLEIYEDGTYDRIARNWFGDILQP